VLESRSAATTVAEVARETGWHENTVRGHLQALHRDGYATTEPSVRGEGRGTACGDKRSEGRGRPSQQWRATWRAPADPYAALASVFAATLAKVSEAPASDARAAGHAWGETLGNTLPRAASPDAARRSILELMRSQGFAPEPSKTTTTTTIPTEIVLHRCPLIEAASRHREVVCAAHHGMVTGALEAIGARDEGSELLPFSAPGECLLRLRVA